MFRSLILAAALGAPWAALAEPVETEIPGVSADVA
jgi:hypothetical protein